MQLEFCQFHLSKAVIPKDFWSTLIGTGGCPYLIHSYRPVLFQHYLGFLFFFLHIWNLLCFLYFIISSFSVYSLILVDHTSRIFLQKGAWEGLFVCLFWDSTCLKLSLFYSYTFLIVDWVWNTKLELIFLQDLRNTVAP